VVWLSEASCSIDDFVSTVEQTTKPGDYPHAARVEQGAVVYDSSDLRDGMTALGADRVLMSEIASALSGGPGIVVFTHALDHDIVDRASVEFQAIIDAERSTAATGGDHFAKPGANDRIWNALQKLAERNPNVFADYYANDIIALAAQSWLGPNYQVTSQVNVVNPGGAAQLPHRDYHLGFMENNVAESYPAHVHRLSTVMTLQGAIAHCDMPLETGPTMYLPHSQKYEAGYVAWRRDDFKQYFAEHHMQVPLAKGDAVFFNPALFHGAGTNHTRDICRMANLLQIGTALGRTLESVDRRSMAELLYPTLLERLDAGADAETINRVVAASAEGYAFPCNLDVDQPIGGLTPPSDADIVRLALDERWTPAQLTERLR